MEINDAKQPKKRDKEKEDRREANLEAERLAIREQSLNRSGNLIINDRKKTASSFKRLSMDIIDDKELIIPSVANYNALKGRKSSMEWS